MNFRCEEVIQLGRERAVELFDSPENLKKWQPGLQSFELISGEAGQPGAKSKLIYKQDGRQIEMIETVETRNLPDEFSGRYDAKGVKNWIRNRFYEEGAGATRWVVEAEFKFSGLMAVLAPLLKGSFVQQTQEDMKRFKQFAESA